MTTDDILSAAASGRRYTFHSHSQFCDGRNTIEEFARAAAEAGFTHYGFSPHSPVTIESPCNMDRADVPAYFAEVDRVRALYGDRVAFHRGMEIDYLGKEWGPATPYFRDMGLDYAIGSVHFVPSRHDGLIDVDGRFESFREKMARHFDNDIRYVVETFYAQSHDMLDAGGFQIIGHFDKIGHNASHFRPGIEDEPWYAALVDGMIDHIASAGVIAEINTKAWDEHRRMFPGERYFSRLAERGIPVVVNSDAHFTHLINAGRETAFAMAEQNGLIKTKEK